MKVVLTIAGSDPFGGAGMQADIKTMTAHDVYGMTAITLLSVQNTIKFFKALPVEPKFLEEQIDGIFSDITPDAVKTGMLLTTALIESVSKKLKEYKPKNILIDPVMIAHQTIKLIDDEAIDHMINKLIPLADIITPNLGETELIADMKINSKKDMEIAAKKIYERFGCAVYTKSGVIKGDADDLLYTQKGAKWIKGEYIDTKNLRGTGCTLSAAIISNLAKGMDIEEACINAKKYVTDAIRSNIQIGHGIGPIHHSCNIYGEKL